ncbi:unnamed protein product [Phyllotreta striolata]|uniref:CRAL-TRIO domain-containing protein n=1 Tax=Phyllotreta striolata TaxID=444603 RepID=A0A9N9TNA3_PHYSR|nr:unnamed protein product [Phyllotreta striolata]
MPTNELLITEAGKVREKWGKSEANLKQDLQILKDWLKTQKHLPKVPDDRIIELLLTNCKYSLEMTKTHLDMYFTVRSLMPEVFDQSHPKQSKHQSIYSLIDYVVLPKLTDSLHRISLMRFKENSAEKLNLLHIVTYGTNLYELRIRHNDIVMGEVIILDCQHFNMGHVMKFTPAALKKCMLVSEKVWGSRIKEFHVINHSPAIDAILTVAKGILSKKLYNRIFLHHTYDGLLEKIPKDLLPSDFCGDQKSIKELIDLLKLKFEECSDEFDELQKLKVDEKLRPEPLNNSEVLGYYGNFKKLDVD